MGNPYRGINDYQMWRRAVSRTIPSELDPVVEPRFKIRSTDKVATAGSCFAQHISKRIAKIGFNYFCTETNNQLNPEDAVKQNYGVFSARYGNIYTVQQLNQLFSEAVCDVPKHETYWEKNSRFFDPYRPNIFPVGFSSEEELIEERKKHLQYVKEMFANTDVFVFTLGLTEGWRSRVDGAAFPLAPGVVAGSFNSHEHEFFNSSIDETRTELCSFISALTAFNPSVKILLTVSPVPLVATYENRHVLSSTVYSKSVLRVAAQEAYDKFQNVDYFPSFEIITGSPTGGLYYEEDMREVNAIGVSHAMRCFISAYTENLKLETTLDNKLTPLDYQSASEIICDEVEIEKSIKSL